MTEHLWDITTLPLVKTIMMKGSNQPNFTYQIDSALTNVFNISIGKRSRLHADKMPTIDYSFEVRSWLNKLTPENKSIVIDELLKYPHETVGDEILNQIGYVQFERLSHISDKYMFYELIKTFHVVEHCYERFLNDYYKHDVLRGMFYNLGMFNRKIDEETVLTLSTILVTRELSDSFDEDVIIPICKQRMEKLRGFDKYMLIDAIDMIEKARA
jgi:hypothetical protein